MLFKFKYLLWYLVTLTFHVGNLIITRITIIRFGVINRPASMTKDQVYKRTNFENPTEFYNSFISNDSKKFCITDIREISKGRTKSSISFSSPYPSTQRENNTVFANLYKKGQKDSVVIFLSGLFINFNWSDRMMTRLFCNEEFDSCNMSLPYHGPRTTIKPGLEWLSSDAIAVTESFVQSVLDVNRLYDILSHDLDYKKIYIVGLSIGGNVASVSTFMRNYEGATYITTGISTSDLLLSAPLRFVQAVHAEMNKKYSDEEIKDLWAMADISRFKSPQKSKRNMIIAGLFDEFAKARLTFKMRDSLDNCELLVYPANHYNSIFFLRSAFNNILRFYTGKTIIKTNWNL